MVKKIKKGDLVVMRLTVLEGDHYDELHDDRCISLEHNIDVRASVFGEVAKGDKINIPCTAEEDEDDVDRIMLVSSWAFPKTQVGNRQYYVSMSSIIWHASKIPPEAYVITKQS